MTRDEWNDYISSHALTERQRGNIMDKLKELRFYPREYASRDQLPPHALDRVDRLDVISWLIDRDIDTIYDLTQGEAGYLVHLLDHVHTRDDLFDLLPDDYFLPEEEYEEPRQNKWVGIAVIIGGIVLAAL